MAGAGATCYRDCSKSHKSIPNLTRNHTRSIVFRPKISYFLLFDKCKPTEILLNICYTLVDAQEIHIGWITDEPLEAPLRGFLPNQPNLSSVIQTWINEIE